MALLALAIGSAEFAASAGCRDRSMTAETLELATHHAAETGHVVQHPAVVGRSWPTGRSSSGADGLPSAGTTLAADWTPCGSVRPTATGWCVMITDFARGRLDATVAHQIFGPNGAVRGAAPVGTTP